MSSKVRRGRRGREMEPRRTYLSDDGDSTLATLREPPVVGVAVAVLAYLSVFAFVTDVVGGTSFLVMEVILTALVAVWAGGRLSERTAIGVTAVGFVLALVGYFFSVPESQRALFTVSRVGQDLLALFSGLSVLRLINVGVWSLLLAPVPTFAAVYLTTRGRYVAATTIAAAVTGFFVLTGDAGATVALAAAVGSATAVGLAGLSAAGLGGVEAQWDTLAVTLAAMIVITSVVTVIPGSASSPVLPGETPTVESSLVTNDDRVSVLGSISLSPEVRFTVESEEPGYWRVGTYDRYTGDGWVRSGDTAPYESRLGGPPGDSVTVEQTVTVRTPFDAIPALNKPVSLDGRASRIAQVTSNGGFVPSTALEANETYTVTSERPAYTTRELRFAGDDYPDGLQSRYTQLPDSTPDRVRELSLDVINETNASSQYAAAIAIERYLESTKEYSLDVPNPSGNIADRFLFEQEAGYCTYFATTMVVMLRSIGVPARFATGYTTGQQVAEDEYVVRGLDAHAWVEVYFPDVGWVRFDPTPAGPRQQAEQTAVEQARQNGVSGVDAAGSENGTYTTPPPTDAESSLEAPEVNGTDPGPQIQQPGSDANGSVNSTLQPFRDFGGTTAASGDGAAGEGAGGPPLPSGRDAVLGVAALIGAVAGARRVGILDRAVRILWLVRQGPVEDPVTATERAYRRLERLGAREYRPRATGETPGQYVDNLVERGLDPAAREVVDAYQRAHYAERIDVADAEATVRTVTQLVRDRLPVLRRLN